MRTPTIRIPCEGSGNPLHKNGMCQMCGCRPGLTVGGAQDHTRPDLVAMVRRGDFDGQ